MAWCFSTRWWAGPVPDELGEVPSHILIVNLSFWVFQMSWPFPDELALLPTSWLRRLAHNIFHVHVSWCNLVYTLNNLIYLLNAEYLLSACNVCPCLSALNGKVKLRACREAHHLSNLFVFYFLDELAPFQWIGPVVDKLVVGLTHNFFSCLCFLVWFGLYFRYWISISCL